MRRLLVVGGIVVGCLALAVGVANAVTNTVTYSVKLKPAKPKPKKGKPANVQYDGTLDVVGPNGQQADSAPTTVIYFPKQLINNAKKFPGCNLVDGQPLPAKCKKAIVGTGIAKSHAGTPGTAPDPTLDETLSVVAVNGKGGKTFQLLLNTQTGAVPIQNRVIPGKLGKGGGLFGYTITFSVPTDLQNVAGLQVALTHFDVTTTKSTVKVGGKKYGYLQLASCPSNHKLPTKTVVNFNNLSGLPAGPPTSQTVTGTFGC